MIGGTRIGTALKIKVEEKQLLTLKAGTFVEGRGADSGVEGSVGIRNTLGNGENLSFSGSYGAKSSNKVSLNWSKPFVYGVGTTLNLSLNEYTTNFLRKTASFPFQFNKKFCRL